MTFNLLLLVSGYLKKDQACVVKGIPWAPFVSNNNYRGVTPTAGLNDPFYTCTEKRESTVPRKRWDSEPNF